MVEPRTTFSIAVLPGDGVGMETVKATLPVLDVLSAERGYRFDLDEIPCGGHYYHEHGVEWPEGSFERVKKADAILLGAVGHEDEQGRTVLREDGELAGYEQVIGMRLKLDLYANVRPVRLYEGVPHSIHGVHRQVWEHDKVDMVIVRENTEEAYVPGSFRIERGGQTELVVSPLIITHKGAERVVRRAFEIAMLRSGCPDGGVRRVTCVDKSNIVRAHRFFRDVFDEVAADFPEVETDYAYVDAFCQWLVRRPAFFDVVVAPNFAGDVTTDLAAVLQGGLGIAAGGNVGDNHAMFEPIHGSAPRHAGKDRVNPIATVLAARMMLEWLGRRHGVDGLVEAGDLLEEAASRTVARPEGRTYDLGGKAKCSTVGGIVAETFQALLRENA